MNGAQQGGKPEQPNMLICRVCRRPIGAVPGGFVVLSNGDVKHASCQWIDENDEEEREGVPIPIEGES